MDLTSMDEYWSTLSRNSGTLDIDRVVAGLHNVEMLEGMSSYSHRAGLYFPKVVEALKGLPREHWDAALAVFGAVVYVPEPFLSSAMQYLWWAVRSSVERDGSALAQDASEVLVMEVDQDGLVPDFARLNRLSARLNGEMHPRLNDVQRIRGALTDVLRGDPAEREHAVGQLRLSSQKRAWIVLTDKALSGQSLLGDLGKVLFLRDLVAEWSGHRPKIFVAAQIITSAAEDAVAAWVDEKDVAEFELVSAIRLDDRARVSSESCRLFRDESTRLAVVQLCEWFDSEVVAKDLSLAAFRERSDHSLALGYKQTGVTLVDYRNTPTNSLPLLWFNSEDQSAVYANEKARRRYVGPFPRVHSRRGPESPRWSESTRWAGLMTSESRAEVLKGLQG